MMTIGQAIERLKQEALDREDDLDARALDMAAEALGKEMPKTARITRAFGVCPACKAEIKGYIKRCDLCNQLLEWRD